MVLELTNIHKKYGANTVLKFDTLKFESGVYWIKGGNGTGKSTLFRVISGLTDFEGEVALNDISLKNQPQVFRSTVSYAEAEPLYPGFITGGELLEFYRDVRKAGKKEVDELVDLFEMRPFLGQKIGDYSSGMLKKTSLICAFVGKIDLYILDEPLITIDASAAAKLYAIITKKVALGKSFLISSHQEVDRTLLKIDAVMEIKDKEVCRC